MSPRDLAEQACHIEIDLLGEPIGKQDQYIAAFGGITCFTFQPDGQWTVAPLKLAAETHAQPGGQPGDCSSPATRAAPRQILKDQDVRSRQNDQAMIDNLHFVKELGYESKAALESGDLRGFAELMHVHWEHKKARTGGMSNREIDELLRAGASQRRAGRQADRRRRRWLPHVLH